MHQTTSVITWRQEGKSNWPFKTPPEVNPRPLCASFFKKRHDHSILANCHVFHHPILFHMYMKKFSVDIFPTRFDCDRVPMRHARDSTSIRCIHTIIFRNTCNIYNELCPIPNECTKHKLRHCIANSSPHHVGGMHAAMNRFGNIPSHHGMFL